MLCPQLIFWSNVQIFQSLLVASFETYIKTTLRYGGFMSVAEKDLETSSNSLLEKKPRKSRAKKQESSLKAPTIDSAFSTEIIDVDRVVKLIESASKPEYIKEALAVLNAYLKPLKERSECDFESLREMFPNFSEVLDFFEGQAVLSKMAGRWFTSRPVLLVGDPGIGKTLFCSTLANRLGIDFKSISCGTLTNNWVISGLSSSYEHSKPGELARFMRDSASANPFIMLDELEKLSNEKGTGQFGAFYSLLEKDSAKEFKDEFLDFEIDMSNVNWIATVNSLSGIPDAIVNRFRVFNVPNPSKVEMVKIVSGMFNRLIEKHQLEGAISGLSDDAAIYIASIAENPRKAAEIMLESFGKAARMFTGSGKVFIAREHCSETTKAKRKVGF